MTEVNALLDVRAVAKILNCSPRSVWAWSEDGTFIPPIRLGRLRRWRLADVQSWIDRQAAIAREETANDWQLAQS